jgi:hypothetical protein
MTNLLSPRSELKMKIDGLARRQAEPSLGLLKATQKAVALFEAHVKNPADSSLKSDCDWAFETVQFWMEMNFQERRMLHNMLQCNLIVYRSLGEEFKGAKPRELEEFVDAMKELTGKIKILL